MKNKTFELTLERRSKYIYAHVVSPVITPEIALEYLGEAIEACKHANLKRLLVFREIPAILADGVVFQTSMRVIEMLGKIKMAVVNPYLELEEDMTFAQNVTTNRGAAHNIFRTVDEAEKWLLDRSVS
ncbi:MAG: hypothetical protein QM785_17985 [Pyrinomonadaceae bacterium]